MKLIAPCVLLFGTSFSLLFLVVLLLVLCFFLRFLCFFVAPTLLRRGGR